MMAAMRTPEGVTITLVRGDITRQSVDVIVNAANSSLLGGGGVDGAIHRRGGPEILAACRKLRASQYGKGLRTGLAVATTAGELDARWVVHTVGPVWSSSEDRSALLASCYRGSLRTAAELGRVPSPSRPSRPGSTAGRWTTARGSPSIRFVRRPWPPSRRCGSCCSTRTRTRSSKRRWRRGLIRGRRVRPADGEGPAYARGVRAPGSGDRVEE